MQWAANIIGHRNVQKLQEHGLTVVPSQMIEQLKTITGQQLIIIDGVAVTVQRFDSEAHLETIVAGYESWD
jgi:ketopantoate reductase